MKMKLISSIVGLFMLTATSAFADNAGVWTKLDLKLPVHECSAVNLRLRLTPEFAFTDDVGGLKQTTLRAGPDATFNKWFNLTLNGVSNTTGTRQDVRAEVQPEFTLPVNDFVFKDRNRLAYRALDSAVGDRWQYANEVKAVYNLPKTEWNLFGAYEGFYDLSVGEGNQHRVMAGTGLNLSSSWHMDVGYMFRTQAAGTTWVKDNFLYVLAYNK